MRRGKASIEDNSRKETDKKPDDNMQYVNYSRARSRDQGRSQISQHCKMAAAGCVRNFFRLRIVKLIVIVTFIGTAVYLFANLTSVADSSQEARKLAAVKESSDSHTGKNKLAESLKADFDKANFPHQPDVKAPIVPADKANIPNVNVQPHVAGQQIVEPPKQENLAHNQGGSLQHGAAPKEQQDIKEQLIQQHMEFQKKHQERQQEAQLLKQKQQPEQVQQNQQRGDVQHQDHLQPLNQQQQHVPQQQHINQPQQEQLGQQQKLQQQQQQQQDHNLVKQQLQEEFAQHHEKFQKQLAQQQQQPAAQEQQPLVMQQQPQQQQAPAAQQHNLVEAQQQPVAAQQQPVIAQQPVVPQQPAVPQQQQQQQQPAVMQQNQAQNVDNGQIQSTSPFNHHVLMLCTNAATKQQLRDKFKLTVSSLLQHSSVDIDFFIVTDTPSEQYITNIMQDIVKQDLSKVKFQMTYLNVEILTQTLIDHVKMLQEHISTGAHKYYMDAIFFLSVALHKDILPTNVKQLVMIDSDLKFRADVKKLFDHFDNFGPGNVMGIAHEQQPVYRHLFSLYRSQNKGTLVGEPPPNGLAGFNSGVMLLDLVKMRNSDSYNSFLDVNVVRSLSDKYAFKGHLGDQDFFTLIALENKDLFYVLPCTWNRQLCQWWKDKGYESIFDLYFRCTGSVNIYHGNCNTPIPDN